MGVQLIGKQLKHRTNTQKTFPITYKNFAQMSTSNMTPIKYERTKVKGYLSPMEYSGKKVRRVMAAARPSSHAERIQMSIADILSEIHAQNRQFTKELSRIRAANLFKSYHPHSSDELKGLTGHFNDATKKSDTSESTKGDIKSTSIFVPIKR
eukprot:TRINITY_DN14101_c0_g2_i1.p1 TRINITY_DN14101_c0_g2~~TRINITY_DN14101_c0_g2_i1.p1  ORF type:complete len:153 (-),score=23.78 TRINITY_DN14101_c0_g2_i1:95-553(-)